MKRGVVAVPVGTSGRIRSRAEGDKRIVLENHGERQEGQHSLGNDQNYPEGISLLVSAFRAANITARRTIVISNCLLRAPLWTAVAAGFTMKRFPVARGRRAPMSDATPA